MGWLEGIITVVVIFLIVGYLLGSDEMERKAKEELEDRSKPGSCDDCDCQSCDESYGHGPACWW